MLSAEPNQRHEVLKGISSERSNNLNQTKYGGENEATEDDIYEFTGRNSEWWMPQGRWDGWIRGSLRLPAAVASRLVSPRPAPPAALLFRCASHTWRLSPEHIPSKKAPSH